MPTRWLELLPDMVNIASTVREHGSFATGGNDTSFRRCKVQCRKPPKPLKLIKNSSWYTSMALRGGWLGPPPRFIPETMPPTPPKPPSYVTVEIQTKAMYEIMNRLCKDIRRYKEEIHLFLSRLSGLQSLSATRSPSVVPLPPSRARLLGQTNPRRLVAC